MAEGGRGTCHRVFKKSSANNKIRLYVARRDLVLEPDRVEKVEGVLLVDPEYADNRNMYGQIIITTRYGREDEEMMGLHSYSESIMNMVKIWPACEENCMNVTVTSLQALVRRLGPNAAPFQMEVSNNGPPSLILWPSKPYDGPPVGITYDVRVLLAEGPDDMVSKHNIVRMGIRVTHSAKGIDNAPLLTPAPSRDNFRVRTRYQRLKNMLTSVVQRRPRKLDEDDPPDLITDDESPQTENEWIEDQENNKKDEDKEQRGENKEKGQEGSENKEEDNKEEPKNTFEEIQANEEVTVETQPLAAVVPRPAPRLIVKKSFLLSAGKLHFETWLDKSSYHHGEKIVVNFRIVNNSRKTVHHIKAKVIQYVDVCMFGNGDFKNVVAIANDDSNSVPPGQTLQNFYTMIPRRVPPKHWIAIEDSVSNPEGCLASTVICSPEDAKERCMYSIFVSYYVKITLLMNRLGGELSVKLPFSLSHAPLHEDPADSVPEESANRPYLEEGVKGAEDEVKDNDEDDIEEDDSDEDDNEENINEDVDNNKDDYEEEDDTEVNINKLDNLEEDTENNDDENVNGGNAAIGNQVTQPKVHANSEGRQCVSADVCVNITEN